MRNIAIVVDRILQEIPDDWPNKKQLQQRVDDRVQSSLYTAPELMWLRWQEVGEILGEELGEPDTEWKNEIADIFGDKK